MAHYNNKTDGTTIVSDFSSQVAGRTFLITGPSAGGIGAETALTLARAHPSTLLLLGRSLPKIQPIIDEIHTISPSTVTKFIPVSLDSLSSVRSAATAILSDSSVPKIDVVINNAAIMACPYGLSQDGYELQFATNHLSHFLLTNLLMPKILAAGPGARIVNVSSTGHLLHDVNWESLDFNGGKDYQPFDSYGQAKTANILFTVGLNKRLSARAGGEDIKSFALHPGSIVSGLQKHMTPEIRDDAIARLLATGVALPEMKTLQQGCSTTLRAALDLGLQEKEGSVYLSHCQIVTDPINVKAYAIDKEKAERLWKLSEEMVGEKFEF
ncbi:Uncharacterized protein BP5553_09705 [Venustampulla echinocandica]|uniref:NAD(P)-binding protein n=1 Tax=Venustampulla echinocandica TaxID=2656787 RepID=A0A370TBT9_9HELO|nr:Uncharacterized protein BP5553_09705 [Venustampulla echinocandica]RDL31496.1 Uncharacterized protein BP5553_09705 [Venustampulla echinocandica]